MTELKSDLDIIFLRHEMYLSLNLILRLARRAHGIKLILYAKSEDRFFKELISKE